MTKGFAGFLLLTLTASAIAAGQSSSSNWVKQEKKDAFTGTSYVQFMLPGKFLTPPQHGTLAAPALVLQCVPGETKVHKGWYSAGKLSSAWIDVGASFNGTANGVPVEYRRDDDRPDSSVWVESTDLVGLFPPPSLNGRPAGSNELDYMLFGNAGMHKVNTTPPVRKLVLMANEYLGAAIVMEFDLTDLDGADGIASQCGLAMYPKN